MGLRRRRSLFTTGSWRVLVEGPVGSEEGCSVWGGVRVISQVWDSFLLGNGGIRSDPGLTRKDTSDSRTSGPFVE